MEMEEETSNNGSRSSDRLSSLPDSLLVEILSRLPIESAAATSALSRRWRPLWTQTPKLMFCSDSFPLRQSSDLSGDEEEEFDFFFTTIDHIFQQLTSPKINLFGLWFRGPYVVSLGYFSSNVESWIRQVCGRNVEEIVVCVESYEPLIPFPSLVFECQCLRELQLFGRFDFKMPGSGIISLPNLSKVQICCLQNVDRKLMGTLFRSCPQLLILDLMIEFEEDGYIVDISAPKLNRLILGMKRPSRHTLFVIDAPKLESFHCHGYISTAYRFSNIPSELLEAFINLWPETERDGNEPENDYLSQTLELLRGISSVRALRVGSYAFKFLNLSDCIMPIFHNLTNLEMDSCWNELLLFLRFCPELEVLTLVWNKCPLKTEGVPIPGCLSTKLKRIEIEHRGGSNEVLKFLEYMLSNASVLERLCVRLSDYGKSELCNEEQFCATLFGYTRSSLTCEIEFSGEHLSASSKGFKNGLLDCQIR